MMTKVPKGMKRVALLRMVLNIHSGPSMQAQSNDEGLPPFTKGWTDSEKTQFMDCVSHISDRNRENTLQLSTDSYACLIPEEFHASYDLCMCAAYGLPKPK